MGEDNLPLLQVEISVDQLKVIGAEDNIKDDFSLVSCLIQKFDKLHQEEWDCFLVDYTSTKSLWNKFMEFLRDKNKKAIASQMRCMSVKAESAMASNEPKSMGNRRMVAPNTHDRDIGRTKKPIIHQSPLQKVNRHSWVPQF